jgi:hypothetical protein
MTKLLAAGGVVLVVLAILLLHELKGTTTVDAAPAAPKAIVDHPADTIAPTAMPVAAAPAPAPVVPDKPKKIRVVSDAFQFEFDDVQPKRLMKAVSKCYQSPGINRVAHDAKLKLTFKNHIVDGQVTTSDIVVAESTLNNKALEQCMIDKVAAYKWKNDILPDWSGEDMLLVRPEQTLKKYSPENLSYDGGGPEFPGGKAKEPVRAERPAPKQPD